MGGGIKRGVLGPFRVTRTYKGLLPHSLAPRPSAGREGSASVRIWHIDGEALIG